MKSISGFCLNSRKWVDFLWIRLPRTCPSYEEKECQYEKCGYWEDRKASEYFNKKFKIIESLGKK